MQTLHISQFKDYLKPRPHDSNKGNFGHVLIVGGDDGFRGAVEMAGMAALRVGAGLVSIATKRQGLFSHPELMCHEVTDAKHLQPLIAKATVIAIGPGLGRNDWGRTLFAEVIKQDTPLVVDADALNLLAEHPIKKDTWVLTPHPGEAARLLKTSVNEIQKNREAAIKEIQSRFGGVCVLKGDGTLVLGNKEPLAICEAGNPGMASGGMGDVLTGVIAGLIAQKIPVDIAAQLGVLIHALAGDEAASKGGERGLIATDLLENLRSLANPKF